MQKVIGMGETILDIIFKENQPVAAVPGGSSFNSIVSVARAGVDCQFLGYAGNDIVGRQTLEFLKSNGVDTRLFELRDGEKSAASLAFLNSDGDASYIFYKEPPHLGNSIIKPGFMPGDVVLFGSYYAACPGMRDYIFHLLGNAALGGAIIYYDLNYRRSHRGELDALRPAILQNYRQSSVVRGSADDFEIMYDSRDARYLYSNFIFDYCQVFIMTDGPGLVTVCTPRGQFDFEVPPVTDVVSTVGAGDNFNAGFACALIWNHVMPTDLVSLSRDDWGALIGIACQFAGEACRSTENYVPIGFSVENPHVLNLQADFEKKKARYWPW